MTGSHEAVNPLLFRTNAPRTEKSTLPSGDPNMDPDDESWMSGVRLGGGGDAVSAQKVVIGLD